MRLPEPSSRPWSCYCYEKIENSSTASSNAEGRILCDIWKRGKRKENGDTQYSIFLCRSIVDVLISRKYFQSSVMDLSFRQY